MPNYRDGAALRLTAKIQIGEPNTGWEGVSFVPSGDTHRYADESNSSHRDEAVTCPPYQRSPG